MIDATEVSEAVGALQVTPRSARNSSSTVVPMCRQALRTGLSVVGTTKANVPDRHLLGLLRLVVESGVGCCDGEATEAGGAEPEAAVVLGTAVVGADAEPVPVVVLVEDDVFGAADPEETGRDVDEQPARTAVAKTITVAIPRFGVRGSTCIAGLPIGTLQHRRFAFGRSGPSLGSQAALAPRTAPQRPGQATKTPDWDASVFIGALGPVGEATPPRNPR